MHHRDSRVHEKCETDSAEHAAVDAVDERHYLIRDFDALCAERFEHTVKVLLELLVNAEALEHRKADGNERDNGQQRRIDEAHCAQRQLAGHDVAQHGPQIPEYACRDAANGSETCQPIAPNVEFELLVKAGDHSFIVPPCERFGCDPGRSMSRSQADVRRSKASLYLFADFSRILGGRSGPGAVLSQSSVSR